MRWDGVIVRLRGLLRKAFVAMVNIDVNDGVLEGLIASRLAPTLDRAVELRSLLKLLPILVRRQFGVLAEQPRKEARIVVADFVADGLDTFATA